MQAYNATLLAVILTTLVRQEMLPIHTTFDALVFALGSILHM